MTIDELIAELEAAKRKGFSGSAKVMVRGQWGMESGFSEADRIYEEFGGGWDEENGCPLKALHIDTA